LPTIVKMEDDLKRYGGGTRPYDAVLERKRQAIRRALKMQYVKTIYDPRNYERSGATRIFDANMARYHALHMTRPDFYYPTLRNVAWAGFVMVFPIVCIYKQYTAEHGRWIANVRNGKWPYDHPERLVKWKLV